MTLPQEVEPIKNTRDINKIKQYLYGKENKRDYCIFVVGINVGLRAGDLLSLKINDVTDGNTIFDTVTIKEQKTGKTRNFALNKNAKEAIQLYINSLADYNFNDYLFKSGIITNNTLSPNTPCTRGETVIYLYNCAGAPESDQINQFYDVPASNVSLNTAVCWAFVNNITGGTSYNYFSPNDTCTRGQIVTFLYRAFK